MAVKVKKKNDQSIAKSLQKLKDHAAKKLEQGTYNLQYKDMTKAQRKRYDNKKGHVDRINAEIAKGLGSTMKISDRFSKTEGELKVLWNQYRDTVNKATGKNTVQKSAEQAFYMYLLAGQLTNFDPSDKIAAYIEGDITIRDDERDLNVPVQLKSSGAQFRNTYTERGVKQQTMAQLRARDKNIFGMDKFWERVTYLLSVDTTPKQSIEDILKDYMKISGATFYVFAFLDAGYSSSKFVQAYGEQSSSFFSVSVRAQDLLKFYSANPNAFMLDQASSGRGGGQIVRFDRPTALSSNRTLFDKYHRNFSIHYQNDQTFYRARKSAIGNAGIQRYNQHVKNNPNFILIHEQLFGGLENPALYYSKNY